MPLRRKKQQKEELIIKYTIELKQPTEYSVNKIFDLEFYPLQPRGALF